MSFSTITLQGVEQDFARFTFLHLGAAGRRRIWRKLAKMLANGVGLMKAIETMLQVRVDMGQGSQPEAIALRNWIASLGNGRTLSESISGWVGDEESMLISAGEASGEMEVALESVVTVMESKIQVRNAVLLGMAYPFVLLVMTFGLMYLIGYKIVPSFSAMAKGHEWTGAAGILVAFGKFAQHWLPHTALAFVSTIALFLFSLPRFDGPIRVILERYPPYSIYRVMHGSSWLISLSSLVSAGMRIESAMSKMSARASPWLARRIEACLLSMRSGKTLGEALGQTGYDFPDREIVADLNVYAELSGLNESLSILGREWLEQSVAAIKARMRVITGAAVVMVASLIAMLVSGMMEMQLQASQIMQQTMQ